MVSQSQRTAIGRAANQPDKKKEKTLGGGYSLNGNRTTTGKTTKASTSGSLTSLGAPAPSTRYGNGEASMFGVGRTGSPQITNNGGGNTVGGASYEMSQTPSLKQIPVGATAAGADPTSPYAGQDLTGWLQGVRPDAIPMLYQEPQALLRNVMAKMGMSAGSNPGLYNMALPLADPNIINALALVMLGADPGFQQGENNQVLNLMGDLFSQGLTRGGQGIDFSSGMDNIMSAGADTALGGFLSLDDPRGQVAAVKSLIGPLAQMGLNPLFARALNNQIDRMADEYYQENAFGNNPKPNFQSNIAGRLGF